MKSAVVLVPHLSVIDREETDRLTDGIVVVISSLQVHSRSLLGLLSLRCFSGVVCNSISDIVCDAISVYRTGPTPSRSQFDLTCG